jgi:hypothetical protein
MAFRSESPGVEINVRRQTPSQGLRYVVGIVVAVCAHLIEACAERFLHRGLSGLGNGSPLPEVARNVEISAGAFNPCLCRWRLRFRRAEPNNGSPGLDAADEALPYDGTCSGWSRQDALATW